MPPGGAEPASSSDEPEPPEEEEELPCAGCRCGRGAAGDRGSGQAAARPGELEIGDDRARSRSDEVGRGRDAERSGVDHQVVERRIVGVHTEVVPEEAATLLVLASDHRFGGVVADAERGGGALHAHRVVREHEHAQRALPGQHEAAAAPEDHRVTAPVDRRERLDQPPQVIALPEAAAREAVHHEALRRVAHVLVGTGHHTKGSRTPSRLPAAVAEYLTHRRVRFWEPQAGMLEVDIASGDFFS